LPLVALTDLGQLGKNDPFYKGLDNIVSKNDYIWSLKAEKYLLANAKQI
jgi:hypothetical protein